VHTAAAAHLAVHTAAAAHLALNTAALLGSREAEHNRAANHDGAWPGSREVVEGPGRADAMTSGPSPGGGSIRGRCRRQTASSQAAAQHLAEAAAAAAVGRSLVGDTSAAGRKSTQPTPDGPRMRDARQNAAKSLCASLRDQNSTRKGGGGFPFELSKPGSVLRSRR
jgi:hypothetical protein